jgi:hypothetical protein
MSGIFFVPLSHLPLVSEVLSKLLSILFFSPPKTSNLATSSEMKDISLWHLAVSLQKNVVKAAKCVFVTGSMPQISALNTGLSRKISQGIFNTGGPTSTTRVA